MAYLERRSHLKPVSPREMPDGMAGDEVTPEHLYVSRRQFLTGVGAVAATAFLMYRVR